MLICDIEKNMKERVRVSIEEYRRSKQDAGGAIRMPPELIRSGWSKIRVLFQQGWVERNSVELTTRERSIG